MKNNFAAFILTHGRPDRVLTYKLLKKIGYTGPIYLIVDNEDDTVDEYKKIYGDKVIMFDKKATSKTFDTFDNFDNRKTIVFARNACFEIAKKLGVRYFIQLDDDYNSLRFRFNKDLEFLSIDVTNADAVFDLMVDFYKSVDIATIAFAQGGDFIGGQDSQVGKLKVKRKAMNTFICDTEKPFTFVGRINEDVNTYTLQGSRGDIFITLPIIMVNQLQTQSNKGGMTDVYLDSGTYIKSFYTVMCSPSSVKISSMGPSNRRVHHRVNWENTVPCILRETVKQ